MLFDCETFVSHLECSETGERYPADQIANAFKKPANRCLSDMIWINWS